MKVLKLLAQSNTQMLIFITAKGGRKVGTEGKKREGLRGSDNLFETDLKHWLWADPKL